MGDWPFWLLGAATSLGGLLLLYAGLFRDRSRGQRRCSQCWYDMSALPGRRCPECGHESPTEARLFRTRRRWRLAAIGVLAALGGAAGGLGPTVRRDGPLAILPTTILLALAPQAGTEHTYPPGGGAKLHPIAAELKRRNAQEHMAAWQWRYYLRRSRAIEIPSRWVRGEQVYIRMQVPRWFDLVEITAETTPPCRQAARAGQTYILHCGTGLPRDWYEGYRPGPILSDNHTPVVLDVAVKTGAGAGSGPSRFLTNPRTLWSGRLSFSCDLVESPGYVKSALNQRELSDSVRQATTASAWIFPAPQWRYPDLEPADWIGPYSAQAEIRVDTSKPPLRSLAFGLRVALVRDGIPMKETAVAAHDLGDYPPGHLSAYVPLRDDGIRPDAADPQDLARWALRIRGVPELALSDYDHDTCWTGQITIPLADVLKQRR